jgi:DNA invertase Pin-like site-specific DNA recombinase
MNKIDRPTGQHGVAYLRVSRDKQETIRQREAINRWAAQRELTIETWFEDTGSRDLAAKRPEFQRLLRAVEAGAIDTIIVDSQDRFGSKDAHEWGKFLSLLGEHGCELWSVAQGLLSATDDATVLTSTIGALTSTREQKEKAGRSIKGKVEKAKEGLYQGGYAPYGLDVACYDRTGKEKWRVHYTGHFERIKIHPDGTHEEFNGKGNFPAKDPTDELRLAPSVDTRRMEIVRQVFETYANEAIALRAIATRLNDLGVDPILGDVWNQPKIKHMLTNPAYIGFPAWNKRGSSRFVEFVDGQFREVPRNKGRVVAGRQRRREDFVQAEEAVFEPIVPRAVWDKVQRKLDEAKKANEGKGAKKGPRSPELWLRDFLVCGRCGKPMRGWHPRNDKYLWKSYFCGTYGKYGAKNPTGCKLHRVKAELLEQVAERYLEEKHRQLRMTIEAQQRDDDELTRPQEEDLVSRWAELAAIERRMEEDLSEGPGPPTSAIEPLWLAKDPEDDIDVSRRLDWVSVTRSLWELFHGQRKRDLAPEIQGAEAELERLVGAYADLPRGASRAREIANRRIEELETKIGAIKGQQEDIGKRWDELSAEFRRRYESLAMALEALRIDSESRRKAEALRMVVDRMVCRFRYSDGKGKFAKSFLDSVEVIPVEGPSIQYYPNANSPEPG